MNRRLGQIMSSSLRLSQRAEWAEGQPISDLMSRALAEPELISLAAGFVDQQTLPVEPTREALASLFADESSARAALQYGTTPGYPPLRQALLERWLAHDACYHELIDRAGHCHGRQQPIAASGRRELVGSWRYRALHRPHLPRVPGHFEQHWRSVAGRADRPLWHAPGSLGAHLATT